MGHFAVYGMYGGVRTHQTPGWGEQEHTVAQLISTTTGDATERFGFRGTDLGYFAPTNHGYVTSIFGDTFNGARPGSGGWRSPVILRTSNRDLDKGVKWDNAVGGARAKEAVPYTHQSKSDAMAREGDGFTNIPNDMVHLPDGRWLLSTFAVRSWDSQGEGGSWLTWANHFWTSTDTHGENWSHARWVDLNNRPMKFDNNDGQGWDKFQNCSLVLWDDGYLYMFGTQSGRYKGGGIYLARVKWQDWARLGAWQFWTWTGSQWAWKQWSTCKPGKILSTALPGGAIGEINAQVIDGVVVLAYADYSISGGAVVTRTAVHPANVWTAPQIHATQRDIPALYAPSIHPYSTLDKPYAHVSQWNSNIYGCRFYSLDALRKPDGVAQSGRDGDTVEGTNVATECVDLKRLTPEQLAEVLTSETSITPEQLLEAIKKA